MHKLKINLESVSLRIKKKEPFHFRFVDHLFCKSRRTAIGKQIFSGREVLTADVRDRPRVMGNIVRVAN